MGGCSEIERIANLFGRRSAPVLAGGLPRPEARSPQPGHQSQYLKPPKGLAPFCLPRFLHLKWVDHRAKTI